MNITVVGTGYVGLSNAMLLSKNNKVIAIDLIEERVQMLNDGVSPINDKEIQEHLIDLKNQKFKGSFTATIDKNKAFIGADYIIIATPTNYDPETNYFDTSSIEAVIEDILKINNNCLIVIKSTVPVGYTEKIKEKFKLTRIIFSPEFLREGSALYDNLNPSRIIVGDKSDDARKFASLLLESANKKDIKVLMMNSTEAEAVKLFSNSYLAMRVSYFNELDSYAEINNLNTKHIIEGMGYDPRIGFHYNNPSFGYGGYCLPKDTKQLKANFQDIPNALTNAIIESNEIRKDFVVDSILRKNPKFVGIYRLVMKKDSDNFRDSAVLGIISRIKEKKKNISILIYEPKLQELNKVEFMDCKVINDLNKFKDLSDIIVANRRNKELNNVEDKIYSRDLFDFS